MTQHLDFASDNWAGVSPRILDAIAAANSGGAPAPAYGGDDVTKRMQARFAECFETDVVVIPVPTGTAANGLALEILASRDGLILGHEEAHIFTKEAHARTFFNDRARIIKLQAIDGRLTPEAVHATLGGLSPADRGPVRRHAMISLTNGTECGTVYTPAQVKALSAIAHRHEVAVHMDGARFANAVASLNCTPAELTWKSGVDVLSFGATKNGALGVDAVVVFDPKGRGAAWAKHAHEACDWFGYVASKSRFASAQLDAMIEDGHWLDLARHANAMADRLAQGLTKIAGVRLAFPREINQVFAILPAAVEGAMRAAGGRFHPWDSHATAPGLAPKDGEKLMRLVASFHTSADEVDRLIAAAASVSASAHAAE